MGSTVDSFCDHCQHLRELTFAFVEAVREASWLFSPHPRFSPFAKHVRHLVCVQGCYQEGPPGAADFGRKYAHYGRPLERSLLVAALREKDAELASLVRRLEGEAGERFAIDFLGNRLGLARYLSVMVQHESIHHGEWGLYAALGSFETPPRLEAQLGALERCG